MTLPELLRQFEREKISEALALTGYVAVDAAVILGIPRRTLYYRLKALGIAPPEQPRNV